MKLRERRACIGLHCGGYNETDRARGCENLAEDTHVGLLTQAYRMRRKPCAIAHVSKQGRIICNHHIMRGPLARPHHMSKHAKKTGHQNVNPPAKASDSQGTHAHVFTTKPWCLVWVVVWWWCLTFGRACFVAGAHPLKPKARALLHRALLRAVGLMVIASRAFDPLTSKPHIFVSFCLFSLLYELVPVARAGQIVCACRVGTGDLVIARHPSHATQSTSPPPCHTEERVSASCIPLSITLCKVSPFVMFRYAFVVVLADWWLEKVFGIDGETRHRLPGWTDLN